VFVLVPKATMNKNRLESGPKDNIWSARQVFGVKSVSQAVLVKKPPDNHLRSGIPSVDARH
jgi:hypothetical protein